MGKATYKTTVNNLPKLIQKSQVLSNKKIEVGVFDGDHAWLAGIHEYGCKITVTPKMRVWLHSHGIHLNKSTTHIVIPERSFLRAGFDDCHEKVCDDWSKAVLPKYFEPYGRYDTSLKQYGKQLASQIKKYARNLKEPPKSSATKVLGIKNSNPLINTGEMINSITYKIEDK